MFGQSHEKHTHLDRHACTEAQGKYYFLTAAMRLEQPAERRAARCDAPRHVGGSLPCLCPHLSPTSPPPALLSVPTKAAGDAAQGRGCGCHTGPSARGTGHAARRCSRCRSAVERHVRLGPLPPSTQAAPALLIQPFGTNPRVGSFPDQLLPTDKGFQTLPDPINSCSSPLPAINHR